MDLTNLLRSHIVVFLPVMSLAACEAPPLMAAGGGPLLRASLPCTLRSDQGGQKLSDISRLKWTEAAIGAALTKYVNV